MHLSYHLKSHYSSVRRADDTCETGVVPVIDYPIGEDIHKNQLEMIANGFDAADCLDEEEPACPLLDKLSKAAIKECGAKRVDKLLMRKVLSDIYLNTDLEILTTDDVKLCKSRIKRQFEAEKLSTEIENKLKASISEQFDETEIKALRSTLDKLRSDKDLMIAPGQESLRDLHTITKPLRHSQCHCQSDIKYSRCCESADSIRKEKVMEALQKVVNRKHAEGRVIFV